MRNDKLYFTEEDFSTIEEGFEIKAPKTTKKLFAGFSSDTVIAKVPTSWNFTTKMAELYLCQLAEKAEILSFEAHGTTLNTFPRMQWLDEISNYWKLESNTLRNSGWGFCYLGDEEDLTRDEVAGRYLQVARFFGFMQTLVHGEGLVALRTINARAFSGWGHNSPRTGKFVHEYNIVRFSKGKYSSPYKLEKMIWATKEKALTKHGIKISFEQALEALGVTKSTSKAATVAAYNKLGLFRDFGSCKSYRHARDSMVAYYQDKAEAKAEVFVIKGKDKLFQYGYRMGGRYTILFDRVDWYNIENPIQPVEAVYDNGLISHNWRNVTIKDWQKARLDKLHDQWSYRISEHTVKGMKLDKIRVLGVGNMYNLHSPLGVIQGHSVRECFTLYSKRLVAESSLDLAEVAPKSNCYLYFTDSEEVGNCSVGTKAMMKQLGISEDTKIIAVPKLWDLAESKGVANNTLLRNAISLAILKGA